MDNLTSIKHLKHADGSDFQQLVTAGWVLLHVYSQTTDNRTKVFYVMGHEGPIKEEPIPQAFLDVSLDKYK
jgi:hypothetical protein